MFEKLFKKLTMSNTQPVTTAAATQAANVTSGSIAGASIMNTVTTVAPTSTYTTTYTVPATGYSYGNIAVAGGGAAGAGYAGAINITNPGNFTFTMQQPSNIITLQNNGQEIVRLNRDGSVTWANGINVDEAAEAFGKSLSYSAELKAGITKGVKLRMRDTVFEMLINIAKEKGPLSADDLTYLLESSKIIEKLKGGSDEF